ncbi:hypothetical protein A2995_01075 [Candidatus Nomurabacteria bacterium RIFCSPLOWO2_01_FULL_33_24]|uniref:Uncharacterized protein n=1 Tax=Candidatus Nomurabacteria bacterium RIFCSPLOWO2_01_FULL_33_24 TaxID=1801765 RepID=A0A1F6WZC9_9BACT|nr:MAG: hypothetical protein A2995_01075 [Candidatus Nomurabacteria bacterium RIFCSPLOWO2_01_FULL_33_24]
MSDDIEFLNQPEIKKHENRFYESKMTQWVLKHFGGFIKNEKQANYFLIGLVVFCFLVAFFLSFGWFQQKDNQYYSEEFINDNPEMITLEYDE